MCQTSCKKKSENKRLTTEEFIRRAILVHGIRYGYFLVNYINGRSRINIVCYEHGVWDTMATSHLQGGGCPKCGQIVRTSKSFLSLVKFIENAKLVHGDSCDYSLYKYVDNKTKGKIICNICTNIFEQSAHHHVHRKQGCPKCRYKNNGLKSRFTNEIFIEKANLVHNFKYGYGLIKYNISSDILKIICPIHGIFEQIAYTHLYGQGCPKCGIINMSSKNTYTSEEILFKFKLIHGERYSYEKMIFINCRVPILIFCNRCNEYFSQRPGNHLTGQGCPSCNGKGKVSEAKLYFKIKETFNKFSIISQAKPEWLRHENGRNIQSLDIYFSEHNIGIEYQGAQHFRPVNIFGGEETFPDNQERDERKRNLCLENDCKLFYFTYTKNDVPKDFPHKVYSDEQELITEIKLFIENERY